MNSSGRDSAVGHIRHLTSWDSPHSLDNIRIKRRFLNHVLETSKRLLKLFISRYRQSFLLG